MNAGFATATAGAFLLLRAANDLRLEMLARHCEYPTADPDAPRWLIAALVARWSGMGTDCKDEGLRLLAGIRTADDEGRFRAAWSFGSGNSTRFQLKLARALRGHRLLSTSRPTPGRHRRLGTSRFVLAGDDGNQVWPLVSPIESPMAVFPMVERWAEGWYAFTGDPLTFKVPPGLDEIPTDGSPPGIPELPANLSSALKLLDIGSVEDPQTDATLWSAANSTVRAWARWLKGVGSSSTAYLIEQFVRRPGRLFPDGDSLLVELEPRPLDVVLEVSGYLEPIELLPGSAFRTIRWRIGGPA